MAREELDGQPVIDMHVHVYTEEAFWGPAPDDVTGQMGPATAAKHQEALLREMDANHVVLAMASAPLGWKNPDPSRFLQGLELHDPSDLDLAKLEASVEAGEVQVLGELMGAYAGIGPEAPVWDPVYALAEAHDIPVAIHMGVVPPGAEQGRFPNYRIQLGDPLRMQDVLVRYPGLRVYLMHAGLPAYPRKMLEMMNQFPTLHVDIGVLAWIRPYTQASLRSFLPAAFEAGFGDRVLFGSDEMVWPDAVSWSIAFIKEAEFLSAEEKRMLLHDNAARFLGVEGP